MRTRYLRLGVNIDHVATIRNARGGKHPDPVRAALAAAASGADGITAHLREDRRHMTDQDIFRLTREIELPLNLEMAATQEMLEIALRHQPHAACIVPEKRQERTTEGGLAVANAEKRFEPFVRKLNDSGIKVSLFIEPDIDQINAAVELGAAVVELHTGAYCEANGEMQEIMLQRIVSAAAHAEKVGIECHAGHGLTFDTVAAVAAIPTIMELNIGHFLIGEAIFGGIESAIKQMRILMDQACVSAGGQSSV